MFAVDGTLSLETERLVLRVGHESMADELTDYLARNQAHFAASGPRVTEAPSRESSLAILRDCQSELARGSGVRFYLFERTRPERIVGNISFSAIMRGVFMACYLGYRIDKAHEGRGIMREGLVRAIGYAFDDLGLHRIMANYTPGNERSGKLLRGLGFVVEGYARDYLMLDGKWQDHILTSLIRPTPSTGSGRVP